MGDAPPPELAAAIDEVTLGATAKEGGTRSVSYRIGGWTDLPILGPRPPGVRSPLVALEVCDDPRIWPAVVTRDLGDLTRDVAAWAREAESDGRRIASRIEMIPTTTSSSMSVNAGCMRPAARLRLRLRELQVLMASSPRVLEHQRRKARHACAH